MTHSLHHLQTCGHNMRTITCKQLGVSGGSSSHYKLGAPYDGQVSGQLREPNNHILGPHSRTPSGGEADDGANCGRKRPPSKRALGRGCRRNTSETRGTQSLTTG